MRRKGAAYYYDHGYVQGRRYWQPLGSDFAAAKRTWADIEADAPADNTVSALLTYYRIHALPQCAERTQRDRRAHIERLTAVFGTVRTDELRPQDVARYLRHHGYPVAANREIGTLSAAFSYAVDIGMANTNPCRQVRRNRESKRDRYITDAEFRTVKSLAPPVVALGMDLAYLTGMRMGDLLALRWDQLENQGIRVRQSKTGAKVLIEWTDDLRSAIEEARALRRNTRGLHVLATRAGEPYSVSGFGAMFRRSMDKAVDKHAMSRFTFHDIRAKTGTDARDAGLDSQALLGHTTEAQHQTYLRSRAPVHVQPVKRL
jgi:integrase